MSPPTHERTPAPPDEEEEAATTTSRSTTIRGLVSTTMQKATTTATGGGGDASSVAAAIQRAQDVVIVEARDISPHRSTTPARRGARRSTTTAEEEGNEPTSPVYYSSNPRKQQQQQQNAKPRKSPTSTTSSSVTPKARSRPDPSTSPSPKTRVKMKKNSPTNKEEVSRLHRLMAYEKSKRKAAQQKQKQLKAIRSLSTDISVPESDSNSVFGPPEARSVASADPSVTSNLLYQALRTGNSSTLSQTKSSGNLNRTLSATSDNFYDFHNPNIGYGSEADNTTIVDDGSSLASSKLPAMLVQRRRTRQRRPASPSEATTTTAVTLDQLPEKSLRSFDSSEEMTFYRYVSKHSILQLCTEDLMSDNWKIVDYALHRLGEVCCCSSSNNSRSAGEFKMAASNRIRFIKAGGHAFVAGVMKKFAQSTDIQISASKLIHQIAQLDRDQDDSAFAELFASVNGLECVVNAIVRGEGDTSSNKVHPHACAALTALVCGSPKMVRRLMQDARHLRIYFAAMKAEASKDQIGTCRVLYLLSSQKGYCAEIVAAGGIDAIGLEMKNHLQEKVVQIFGCWALANLAEHTTAGGCATAMQKVGCLAILMAMKTYPKEEKVQEKATLALFHVSKFARQEIKQAGGLSTLGCSLETFPDVESIQQHGSATIKRLLESTPSNKKKGPKS